MSCCGRNRCCNVDAQLTTKASEDLVEEINQELNAEQEELTIAKLKELNERPSNTEQSD